MSIFDIFKKKYKKEPFVTETSIESNVRAESVSEIDEVPESYLVERLVSRSCGKAWALPVSVDASNVSFLKSTYVAFDVETTGLDASCDRIIEVGAVWFVDGCPTKTFSSLVNPERNVPESATAINHITNAMVASAPSEQEVFNDLIEFLGKAINGEVIMCAHNARFDFKFLCKTLSRLGYNAEFKYIDTLNLSRTYIKGVANYKQSTLERYFGLTNENVHRAVFDAENCGKILYCILDGAVFVSEEPFHYDYSEKGHKYWSKGENDRLSGDLDSALRLFDKARKEGYAYPVLYESWAKTYRKLKDFENEILILEEAIQRFGEHRSEHFEARKIKAQSLLLAQREKENARQKKILEKAMKEEEKRHQKENGVKKPQRPVGRPVIQYTDDGTVVKEFDSITIASREVGISTKCIRDAAIGKQKHAGGYCWKYATIVSVKDGTNN